MALDKNDKKFIQKEVKTSGEEIKKELRREIQTTSKNIEKELKGEIQLAVERSEERVVNVLKDFIEINNRNLLNEFYGRVDPILMEIQAGREERAINAKNISKNSDILASHEKRINKLELVK